MRTKRLWLCAALALHACADDRDDIAPSVRFAGEGAPCSDASACVTEGLHVAEVDGITVLHRRLPGSPVVAMRIVFDGGAARWAPRLAHAESVLFRLIAWWGSDRFLPSWQDDLARIGARFGVYSGLDYAQYSMVAPVVHVDRAFELLAAAVLEPPLGPLDDESNLEHVKSTFQYGSETALDEASSAATITAWSLLTENHPYAVRNHDDGSGIANVTVADLSGALSDLRRKSLMTVVVVGDVTEGAVKGLVAQHFAALQADEGGAVRTLPPLSPSAGPSVILDYPAAPAFHITGYFPAPSPLETDYAALELGLQVLSSRLFDEVRIERALVYSISSGVSNYRSNYGYLTLSSVAPAEAMSATRAIVDELLRDGIDEAELASERARYGTSAHEANGTATGLAYALVDWRLTTGGQLSADDHMARIEAVTASEARDAVARYLPAIRYCAAGPNTIALDETALAGPPVPVPGSDQ